MRCSTRGVRRVLKGGPLLCLGWALLGLAGASSVGAVEEDAVADDLQAVFTGAVAPAHPEGFSSTFSNAEPLSVELRIHVAAEHVGLEGELFLAGSRNGRGYRLTSEGWRRWRGALDTLQPFQSKVLDEEEVIALDDLDPFPPGEYRFQVGYRPTDGEILLDPTPFAFVVFGEGGSRLHRFRSESMLGKYLKEGLSADHWAGYQEPAIDFSASPGGSVPVSGTNLQEAGVDEADTIKNDGEHLYVLTNCEDPSRSNNCVRVFNITENPAESEQINQWWLEQGFASDGLYLLTDREPDQKDLLIATGTSRAGGKAPTVDYSWSAPWDWDSTSTQVVFYDVTDPTVVQEEAWLKLDGALVSSRRVGDTLYLVTRYTPSLPGFVPYPRGDEETRANTELLQQATLSDLLPHVRTGSGMEWVLTEPTDCYLPPAESTKTPDPSIVTVTAVPVDAPDQMKSICIAGSSETVYASPESLYLVTGKRDYEIDFFGVLAYPDAQQNIQIHKFGLSPDDALYRGSAEVEGHLGWETHLKSFRLGEHEGVLRVATSFGHRGRPDSTTSVTLLKEREQGKELEEISRLDNLGKPGDALYAARFLGDRGYLVTFEKVDPLYILDLSDPYAPVATGELEVEGYSEYLHPIGEDFLLGIGKDTVLSESGDFSWYQGVRLSLFDVSDLEHPTEVAHEIIGKRGSSTAVLDDHRAFSYLPPDATGKARFAVPIEMHDRPPEYYLSPSSSYGWTHTGLYIFDIDTNGTGDLDLEMIFIARKSPDSKARHHNTDRSVLQGDSGHYVYGGEVLSGDVD